MNSALVAPLTFVLGGNPTHLLLQSRRYGDWRPTVVMLTHLGAYTMVLRGRNGRKKLKKDLPKGGVERYQTVLAAVYAELREEARVQKADICQIQFLGHSLVPFSKHNYGRDGYRKGKIYLIFHVTLRRGATFAAGKDHRVTSIIWRLRPDLFFNRNSKKRSVVGNPMLRNRVKNVRRA